MNRLKFAELTSGVGALVLGVGLGALLPHWFGPTGGLITFAGLSRCVLANLNPGDPRRSDISEIQKAGASAARLTRQLLAFSRKGIIAPTRLDLNVVVGSMRAMLMRLVGEDVNVVLSLCPDGAPILEDRGQMEQIVLNLAVNARHDADLHTRPAAKPGAYVTLALTDSGTGMTP